MDAWVEGNLSRWLNNLISSYFKDGSSDEEKTNLSCVVILCWSVYSMRNKSTFNQLQVNPHNVITLANKTLSNHLQFGKKGIPSVSKIREDGQILSNNLLSAPHNTLPCMNIIIDGKSWKEKERQGVATCWNINGLSKTFDSIHFKTHFNR